jgi:hypothetical protein
MNSKKSSYLLSFLTSLFLLVLILFNCNSSNQMTEEKANSQYRFIYNNDGTEILGNRWHNFRPLTIEDVHSYVDVVANSPVTTFMICSGSMLTYYKSQYERSLGSLPEGQNPDIGNDPVLAENMQKYDQNYKALQDQNTDIVELCVNRAKEKVMEAFISMRMNDLHFTDPKLYCPSAQSDFWLQHPELRMGNYPGWNADGALNFAHKEVRQYKLNLIREQCERFDIDGIELDFMRFIVYFPYQTGRDYLQVMTDFLKKARQITNQIGEKRGRPLLLAVRVPARMKLSLEKGLDVPNWADQNIIDMITVSSHWLGDPTLPVREFKEALGKTNIPVYASLESGQYNPYQFRTNGTYRAVAAHCLNQGADGIYLFNFFFQEYLSGKEKEIVPSNIFVKTARVPALLDELGKLETLQNRNKIYTFSDGVNEYGYQPNTPLPLLISPWWQEHFDLEIAEDLITVQPQNVYLFLRTRKGAKIAVSINDLITEDADQNLILQFGQNQNLGEDEEVIVRKVPIKALKKGINNFSIRSMDPLPTTITRVELAIQYGDVKTHGYF